MEAKDCAFEAFITNIGKYNEGMLVGEWVKFPTTNEELQQVFERIGINRQYEEWFITDYECESKTMYETLGEYESLSELNYLAHQMMDLSSPELWDAALEYGDSTSSVKDMINLTENLDCYDFLPDIYGHEDLGYYWIEESGCYDTNAMGNLSSYIDYERFGRDVAMDESGAFTDQGYIRSTGDSHTEIYNGEIEDIPEEYRLYRIEPKRERHFDKDHHKEMER
ncbi:antirestriction protein ArdA [Eubacteriales bacterium OttesenSCG-928-M02]|nr:antirestriction protein ArdA [Eubacteriales bacterium OttesenSCG-928-M02]